MSNAPSAGAAEGGEALQPPSLLPHTRLALYSVKDLRAIEAAAQAQLPPHTLMQRAGRAAAQWAQELLTSEAARLPGHCAATGDALQPTSSAPRRVLAVAGPGNNGGDALEAALCLCQAGIQAQVLLLADAKLAGDALLAWQRASQQGVLIHAADSATTLFAQTWDLVVDGLFGIGLTRAIAGPARAAVLAMNDLPCPLLALDLPSGLDADTGRVVGAEGVAVRATHTLSFIAGKPGLHTGAARDLVGELRIADLDIDPALFPAAQARAASVPGFAACLKPRRHDSHKGSYGDVMVLGGAQGMTGAPVLGARAALHCGAGRVHIGFIDQGLAADAGQPELMCRKAEELDFNSGVTVAGPGMGQQRHAADQLARALSSSAPLVLDADALNLVAAESALRTRLQTRRAPTLITPHPLEAARLLGSTVAAVQNDRLAAARTLAADLQAVVILKGSGSVLARPDAQVVINTTGNPALATAGSGDVLAGVCGALLAQGWPAWEAAQGAAWMHGAAAERLEAQGVGPIGLVASELIPALRSVLNALVRDCAT